MPALRGQADIDQDVDPLAVPRGEDVILNAGQTGTPETSSDGRNNWQELLLASAVQ